MLDIATLYDRTIQSTLRAESNPAQVAVLCFDLVENALNWGT